MSASPEASSPSGLSISCALVEDSNVDGKVNRRNGLCYPGEGPSRGQVWIEGVEGAAGEGLHVGALSASVADWALG